MKYFLVCLIARNFAPNKQMLYVHKHMQNLHATIYNIMVIVNK